MYNYKYKTALINILHVNGFGDDWIADNDADTIDKTLRQIIKQTDSSYNANDILALYMHPFRQTVYTILAVILFITLVIAIVSSPLPSLIILVGVSLFIARNDRLSNRQVAAAFATAYFLWLVAILVVYSELPII